MTLEDEDRYDTTVYRDINGVDHADYVAACRYYGAETPEELAGRIMARYRAEMEAAFGPVVINRLHGSIWEI